jgi:hypothetical protein
MNELRASMKLLNYSSFEGGVSAREDQMIQRLHDGWQVVQALNHDKYLLEKA